MSKAKPRLEKPGFLNHKSQTEMPACAGMTILASKTNHKSRITNHIPRGSLLDKRRLPCRLVGGFDNTSLAQFVEVIIGFKIKLRRNGADNFGGSRHGVPA